MRIALVVTRMTDENLCLASQVGVTDIIGRYAGPRRDQLEILCQRVERHGMRLSVLEGYVPHGDIMRSRPRHDEQIESYLRLIGHMGKLSVEVCCCKFMPLEERARTGGTGRSGAEVTAFEAMSRSCTMCRLAHITRSSAQG